MIRISNVSKMLESYFPYCPSYKKQYNSNAFIQIYDDIKDGFNFVENNKHKMYKFSIEHNIHNAESYNYIPLIVRENIENIKNNLSNCLSCEFLLNNRKIKIFFILDKKITKKIIEKYTNFVFLITVWLYIISKYSSCKCSQKLNIYIYSSSLLKMLPRQNIVLNQEQINTAFTSLCSEIIIFRNEEWFKVFIHETLHNFNLDFSNMNLEKCNRIIKNIFHVNSDVNLYEAYAEFWGRIMNISFISYIHTTNFNNFSKVFERLLNVEISYSNFQMIKILDHMNLTYHDITNNFQEKYKESTNVLSYFVITNILIFNYIDFLSWCYLDNNLYNFKKTNAKILDFCKFIKSKYYDDKFLENIDRINEFYLKTKMSKNKNKKINYLIKNLRMTIYELI